MITLGDRHADRNSKIGNSARLLLSKAVLEQFRVRQGDLVDLTVENGVLTLKPIRRFPREGWAAAAMAIAAAGEDGLAWPEFGNEGDEPR